MKQYERGTRTEQPVCPTASDCNGGPPLTDPCSAGELERCGCAPTSSEVLPLTIQGFQLYEQDVIELIPEGESCGATSSSTTARLTVSMGVVSEGRDYSRYYNVSALSARSGYYTICGTHFGESFLVGRLVVRPSCRSPLVLVSGTCVATCPATKIPVAGECILDPALRAYNADTQALMLAVRMNDPAAIRAAYYNRSSEDAMLKYFQYRFRYELARLLDMDATRIVIV